MHRITLTIVSVIGLIISGCAQAPVVEMEEAQAAVAKARASDAARYAPSAVDQAEAALAEARAEMETQADAFPLLRSYAETGRLLTEAKDSAARALDLAAEAREQARVDATDALERANELLAQASQVVEEMPAKLEKAEAEEMSAVLDDAVAALDSARTDFERGDYLAALSKADGAQSRLTWIIDSRKGEQST